LLEAGIESGETAAETELIIAHISGLSGSEQIIYEKPIPLPWREDAASIIEQRKRRVPLQYILGRANFMGLEFMVAPGVFIPRQDTEAVIETALRVIPADRVLRIIDIGTGSGALAITIAKYLPQAEVSAVDISSLALEMARKNARANGVLDRITFVHADWRAYLPKPLDVIISNPPYIPRSKKPSLPSEVVGHEPHEALFGEDEDGLGHYRQIATAAPLCFHRFGRIICEFGDEQSEAVAQIFTGERFSDLEITNDMSSKPRVISAVWTKG